MFRLLLSQRRCISKNHKVQALSGRTGGSEWTRKLQRILATDDEDTKETNEDTPEHDMDDGDGDGDGERSKAKLKKKKSKVADTEPIVTEGHVHDIGDRPPVWLKSWQAEFPPETPSDRRYRMFEATKRIAQIAANRVLEPSAVALLGASASVVFGIGAIEGSLFCAETPFLESMDAAAFVVRYSLEQLLPSCLWSTQDAKIIATAMGYDPSVILRSIDPTNPADATTILNIHLLATCRSMAAGFMLLAQLVRAGTIGVASPVIYEERIRQGREPPVIPIKGGLIVRLCGIESGATVTSLFRMRRHLFPIFEDPSRVSPLVSQYSNGGRFPVFWCVRPDRYGSDYSWRGFPVSSKCFVQTRTGQNVLVLEADATNSNDPMSLGDQALDLTIDDTSQGFRRIQDLFVRSSTTLPPFTTLRVYLGNSLETARSGGGHVYTLRHRVRYAKEVDVLIDSRAPVLKEILCWCDQVAGIDRRILFQTSNRQYFLNLQLLMRRYGYEIYDPLDWRMFDSSELQEDAETQTDGDEEQSANKDRTRDGRSHRSLLRVLLDDGMAAARKGSDDQEEARAAKEVQSDTLRRIIKLSKLPRLVYYGKTAETVNAVQALLNAGEVHAANCCALLDKQEGTEFLKEFLDEHSELIEKGNVYWGPKKSSVEDEPSDEPNSGLHIICSSTIYDDLFRQVREWTRLGYDAAQIQRELDTRYQGIIKQSQEVRDTVTEFTMHEETSDPTVEVDSSTIPEDTEPRQEDVRIDEEKNA